MEQIQLVSLTIFAGILAQILAYKLRLPAIVPLLVIGSILGQFHFLNPDQFGEGLHTIVQLGVAIILFEGGMSLKIKQFKEAPPPDNSKSGVHRGADHLVIVSGECLCFYTSIA